MLRVGSSERQDEEKLEALNSVDSHFTRVHIMVLYGNTQVLYLIIISQFSLVNFVTLLPWLS